MQWQRESRYIWVEQEVQSNVPRNSKWKPGVFCLISGFQHRIRVQVVKTEVLIHDHFGWGGASVGHDRESKTDEIIRDACPYMGMWCSWLSRSLSMREGSGSIPDMSKRNHLFAAHSIWRQRSRFHVISLTLKPWETTSIDIGTIIEMSQVRTELITSYIESKEAQPKLPRKLK